MTFSKHGSNDSWELVPPINVPGGKIRGAAPAIFRFYPCNGFIFSWSITGGKTVFQNKIAISWECCPSYTGVGYSDSYFPVIHPPCVYRVNKLSNHSAILVFPWGDLGVIKGTRQPPQCCHDLPVFPLPLLSFQPLPLFFLLLLQNEIFFLYGKTRLPESS